jgi:hypothetical protein
LTKNLISTSADFHGTLTVYALTPNSPAILHQRYTSNFIHTLRANGGDSAYVPTTSIYSSVLDEIVQPQAGDGASAFINDARQVGVLNVDLQQTCPLTPAGLVCGHIGVLYNAVAWALAKDAILKSGPARLDRIDLPTVSMQPIAPGLTLLDVDMTHSPETHAARDLSPSRPSLLIRGRVSAVDYSPCYRSPRKAQTSRAI